MHFGKPDISTGCPRCLELANGAAPRQQAWRGLRARNEAIERMAVDAHFAPNGPHAKGLCGPVCTFGDF